MGNRESIYYAFVLIALIILILKYRKYQLFQFFILLFFNGLFAFFGKETLNFYKIVTFSISLYYLNHYNLLKVPKTTIVKITFLIFSITFIITSILSGDYFSIIFSQYSRYFILFVIFLLLISYREKEEFRRALSNTIYDILIIQISLSVVKYLIIGTTESIVGSISYTGGAMATSLPILGFMFLWIRKNGQLKRNDWITIIGLMFIGFVSIKRAIWFIMPAIIGMFIFYVPGRKISFRIIILGILAIPTVFYLGVKLNPSLNKENEIGGSFDLDYATDYAKTYMFGEGLENKDDKTIYGRGGATFSLINNFFDGTFSKQDFLGHGLRLMYATDYEEFLDLGFGLNHKGSATGVYQTMITNGYIGILTSLLFCFSMLIKTSNSRIRYSIFAFFIWEYFFYTGIVFREPALSFLLIYIVLFSPKILIETKFNQHNFEKKSSNSIL